MTTATEEQVQNIFGLEPNIDRPMLLPLPLKQEDGSREWTAPHIAYEAARAFVTPGVAAFDGGVTEEDVINFGLTFTGAGVASRVTTGGVRATTRQIDDAFLKPKRDNEATLEKARREGVWHSDSREMPYSRNASSMDAHLVREYDPYYSTDAALKKRYNEVETGRFVTPYESLSDEFSVNVASENIARVYDNMVKNKPGNKGLISSDFGFLYRGTLDESTLKSLFDFRLPKHIKKLKKALRKREDTDMFPFELGQGGETVATYKNADELINSQEFKEGHWELLEDPKIVNALMEEKFSGSIVTETYSIAGVRQRYEQFHLYRGDSVKDLELIVDALPDLYKRLQSLKKNKEVWKSAIQEKTTLMAEKELKKTEEAITFIEGLILKKDGKVRRMGEENFSEDELKLLEEQGYVGKVDDVSGDISLKPKIEENIIPIDIKDLEFKGDLAAALLNQYKKMPKAEAETIADIIFRGNPTLSQKMSRINLLAKRHIHMQTPKPDDEVIPFPKKSPEEEGFVPFPDAKPVSEAEKIAKIEEAARRYDAGLDAGKLPEGDPRLGEDNVRNLFPRKNIDEIDE